MAEKNKALNIEILRIQKGTKKSCECLEPSYTIDDVNKFVFCNECGAIVNPYIALVNIAKQHERVRAYEEKMKMWKVSSSNPENLVGCDVFCEKPEE